MAKRLVITHPSVFYDNAGAAAGAIRTLASGFKPEDVYVLHEYRSAHRKACVEYLRGVDGHWIYSEHGEINCNAMHALLNGCDEVLIVGHLFGGCHRDTYNDVIAGSDGRHLNVQIPLRASSVRSKGFTAADALADMKTDSLEYLRLQNGLTELDAHRDKKAAIDFAASYIYSALQLTDSDIDFCVDSQPVLRRERGNGKIVVNFQT